MNRLIPFILILISTACLADSGAYRVEVIIFRNLDVMAEPDTTETLRSFSRFPSLDPGHEDVTEPEDLTVEIPDDLAVVLPGDLPDDLAVISDRSAYMDDVWRRLRSSKIYRPLLWTSWQQNRVDYYPPMRIHDTTLIDRQLRPPTNKMVADLTAIDPLARYRSDFYQLDGSVQLRRSRFLHVFLDLEIREIYESTIPDPGFDANIDTVAGLKTGAEGPLTNNMGHKIHFLKQNRQVQTGKLQYFDTPYFGVLVFVTTITE